MSSENFNILQQVKRRFFAMRNGVIADALRKGGSPYKIIFGLNIVQIKEIASDFQKINGLSQILWENNSTRESMLIAPMLMNPSKLNYNQVLKLIEESPDIECLDMLVHSLLRKMDSIEKIVENLESEKNWKARYVSMRLTWLLLRTNSHVAKKMAETELEKNDWHTKPLAEKILNELQFSV